MKPIPKKQYKSLPFEIKAVSSDGGEFEGYAAVFGNIDRGGDIIVAGAFADTLPAFEADGVICWQHDWDEPIGKPLDAYEDGHGLYIKASLSDTTRGRDARQLMVDGVVKKLSIGYRAKDYEWLNAENIAQYVANAQGLPLSLLQAAFDYGRALKKIELYEVSPVSVPMNTEADITDAKSFVQKLETERDFEEFLRDAGFSKSQAVAIALHGFKALRRDAERVESDLSENALTDAANAAYARFQEITFNLSGGRA